MKEYNGTCTNCNDAFTACVRGDKETRKNALNDIIINDLTKKIRECVDMLELPIRQPKPIRLEHMSLHTIHDTILELINEKTPGLSDTKIRDILVLTMIDIAAYVNDEPGSPNGRDDILFILENNILEQPDESSQNNDSLEDDPDLPDAPKLEMYRETFGGIVDVTNEQ